MGKQLTLAFEGVGGQTVSAERLGSPRGYTGLYRFHKYWGKKPHEPLAYLIEHLTEPGDIVLDPFCGSGVAGREALLLSRSFVGFDINPIAFELTRVLLSLPDPCVLKRAIQQVEEETRASILSSYLVEDGETCATHYLWEGSRLMQVWVAGRGAGRKRRELEPTAHDITLSQSFSGYASIRVRPPRFFSNSRINAAPTMTLDSILTGRAQRNIDLLIAAIERQPEAVRTALGLCLTAASGQMTRMVFAVTGRGKTTGNTSDRVEVGSWVIGYWRPRLHFEVNVWNCFAKRTSTLLKAISETDPLIENRLASNARQVVAREADAFVACGDCRLLLHSLPDASVQLVITDPPHCDRMPYLELSEFWNSILGFSADFQREIVISNARERGKTPGCYSDSLAEFLAHVPRVLRPSGVLVLLFNSRHKDEWSAFREVSDCGRSNPTAALKYLGYFPCNYSAGSVVQDNRKGGLKQDVALVFSKMDAPLADGQAIRRLQTIPQWSSGLPQLLQDWD